MARKKGVGRIRGARTASKKQEREIIERAKRLREDPTLVIPDLEVCGGSCFLCPFAKALKRMEKVQEHSEDEDKLAKFAKKGDEISKAYAATLIVAITEKAPFFGRALTPYGEAFFVQRGKCKKHKLIGVQHFDDPSLRLMSVIDFVRKKKYHIYSLKDGMICTGKTPQPPQEFVDELLDHLRVDLRMKDDIATCRHLSREELDGPEEATLRIDWLPADITIAFCRRCAKSSGNTFSRFLERMAVPRAPEDFEISVPGSLKCEVVCEGCPIEVRSIDPELIDDYFNGKLDDEALIKKHLSQVHDILRESGHGVYIIMDRCFGEDRAAFMEALDPSPEEAKALRVIFDEIEGPIIVPGETAAKLIERYWKDHGVTMLDEITGDHDLAEELYGSGENGKENPTQVLRKALVEVRERDIISNLPEYGKLPAVAKFADKVARTYKASGRDDAARLLERELPSDTRVKSVAYALLKAMGKEASKDWVFADTERDFAEFLEDCAKDLLEADPEAYHEALQNLLNKTGSTKKIKVKGGGTKSGKGKRGSD